MKKIFFLLITTAGFVACKKNNMDAPAAPANTSGKIKTWVSGATITTYTYDAQGRVIVEANSDGSGYEYEYLTGIVNEKQFNAGHVLNVTYKNELNADGLVIRKTASNNAAYEELYTYNADKTEAKQIGHYSGGITQVIDYYYSNDNCDSSRFSGNSGVWSLTIQRTYYPDKLNSIASENQGEFFYGKDNANLQKTEIYKYSDGSTNTPTTFTYEFDTNGRVVKQTGTQGNNINIGIFSYY